MALVDISGSMSDYSRALLQFLHALTAKRRNVSSFLFGTRLTNVTRALKTRDADEALALCSQSASDWSGGTRIASALQEFNKRWSRRVLSQGAIVLLVTDGLEREGGGELTREMDRLHRSSRRLIWLNPLLRFGGFEARAAGIRAMLPHVDEMRPVHDLASLQSLCLALTEQRRLPRTRSAILARRGLIGHHDGWGVTPCTQPPIMKISIFFAKARGAFSSANACRMSSAGNVKGSSIARYGTRRVRLVSYAR